MSNIYIHDCEVISCTNAFKIGTETSIKDGKITILDLANFQKQLLNLASVMVMKDLTCWAKCCYELTDFGTHAAVSVVTKGDSDDANGCNLEGSTAWLQVARVGNNFAFHYSVDGENFYMMRYFHLPVDPVVKVGLLAQAPVGDGGLRVYEHLSIENITVRTSEPENKPDSNLSDNKKTMTKTKNYKKILCQGIRFTLNPRYTI